VSRGEQSIVALVVAAVLVIAAVVVLDRFIEDDDARASGDGRRVRLLCIADLASVCEALPDDRFEVETAVANETAAELVALAEGDTVPYDAWLTLTPYVNLVDEQRDAAGLDALLAADNAPLASTQLTWVVRADRERELVRACDGELSWACLAEHAGTRWTALGGEETWGQLRVGHANPVRSGIGLLVIGQIAASLLAPAPVAGLGRDDFNTPEFLTSFQRLERDGVPSEFFSDRLVETPLQHFVGTSYAAADLVAVTQAEVAAGRRDTDATVLVVPEPAGAAVAVLADLPAAGTVGSTARDAIAAALRDAGWNGSPDVLEGLPRGAVLHALVGVWEETVQ
jgi:hypothetical protein